MSYHGKNPRLDSIRYFPLDADPANPAAGDIFYAAAAHGTKDEGLWLYDGSSWSQVSTGATLSTLANLTLTPQASDPGSPAVGMIHVADGTARAAGLWIYTSDGWAQISGVRYQAFTQKAPVTVRLATTANITLASQLENGDTIDSVVLVTGDRVLVKNQTTASENGIYVVAASGAPTRATDADTFTELNNMVVYVDGVSSTSNSASSNKNKYFYQTATLTSLSDNQSWGTTPPTFSWTVPAGVYEIDAEVTGGGGGGAGGQGGSSPPSTLGHSAGGGALPVRRRLQVTPGQVLTITVGMGGLGPYYSAAVAAGSAGGDSSIIGTGVALTGYGAPGGPLIGASAATSTRAGVHFSQGGAGNSGLVGSARIGQSSLYASGGAGGSDGTTRDGNGGGAGLGAGAAAGNGSVGFSLSHNSGSSAAADSSAGGGGAGYSTSGGSAGTGGRGGSGKVVISW